MSFFKKEESYLGVDIGAGGLKLVELRKVKGRPVLWTYGMSSEPMDIHPIVTADKSVEDLRGEEKGDLPKKRSPAALPADTSDPRIEKYAGYLRAIVSAAHVSSRSVTASIPVSHIFHAVVTIPPVPEREVGFHVLAKAKKMLPRPAEEMQIVHQVIPDDASRPDASGKKDIKALVTAAPKDVVAFYTAIFQKAGMTLSDLETEAFAIERSLVGHDTATVMIVDIGAERTNFFIMDKGLPITHRTIQAGGNDIDAILASRLGVSRDIVAQIKMDMSSAGAAPALPGHLFQGIIDPIVNEIRYGFDLFLGQSGNERKKPEKIILTGGSALFPPLLPAIAGATGMKTFIGDPWARVVHQEGLKKTIDAIAPRMSVAIGLALRNIVP